MSICGCEDYLKSFLSFTPRLERAAVMSGETRTERKRRLARERDRRYRERRKGTAVDNRDNKERSRQRRLAGTLVDNRDHKELSRQRRAAGTLVDRRDQKERSRQRRLAGTHADYRVRSRKQGRKEETPCTSNLVQESGAPGNGSALPIPAVETPWELRICIVCFGIKVFARPAAVVEPYTCPPCSVFSKIKQGPMQLQPGKDAFPGIIEQTPDSVPPERQPEPNVSTSLSESGGQ